MLSAKSYVVLWGFPNWTKGRSQPVISCRRVSSSNRLRIWTHAVDRLEGYAECAHAVARQRVVPAPSELQPRS